MKVKAEMSIDSIFSMKTDSGKISKKFKDLEADEMQACFLKLKQLVPTIPANKKISKVQLLQHVIDYILDLQLALETHPSVRSPPPQLTNTMRVPLGDLSMENTSVMPIFHEASHLEKLPAELVELISRPVSC